ncbi:ferredoxin--NADP reductase [Alteromonas oceanisediminis]|uniref:ferredoxin--NADP reductase n=1 Tax=Alteromonas oceanisediminis TaxID=2836180 RepID=UPI001BDAA357|nr:ferredoxin--NADP reductase [Alteromonas oceanisediminis]MBT0587282.1 ferredoxin--NADP reductase [Alteromonas oceanisediminis]
MRNTTTETVTAVHHWNDTLFSFKTTRGGSFTFENGQFVMIGLQIEGRPLLRAYSIASANYEDELEFFSIKVPDGALTSRLQSLRVGDEIILTTRPTGTLVPGYLKPGKHLYLLSSGTGLAPFLSIIKDPFIYDAYEKVVLVHSVRTTSELAYQQYIEQELPANPYFGDAVSRKLIYYPIVTREPFKYRSAVDVNDSVPLNGMEEHSERITTLLRSERLIAALDMPLLNCDDDRFMICGNNDMLQELMSILDAKGFQKATSRSQGEYVIEQAFIEK